MFVPTYLSPDAENKMLFCFQGQGQAWTARREGLTALNSKETQNLLPPHQCHDMGCDGFGQAFEIVPAFKH